MVLSESFPSTATPIFSTCFTASLLIVGSVPGCPMHTGQIFTLGRFSLGSFLESQNILVCVFNSACTSSPIVGLYSIVYLRETPARLEVSTSDGVKISNPMVGRYSIKN